MRYLTCVAAAVAVVVFVSAPRPQAQGFSFGAPAGNVDAPNPDEPLYFEAASVKPSDPKAGPGMGTGTSR